LSFGNEILIDNLTQWIELNEELKVVLLFHWKDLFSMLENNPKIIFLFEKISCVKNPNYLTNSFSHSMIILFFHFEEKSKIKKICLTSYSNFKSVKFD
jgi:hypothetical protein